MNNKTVAVVGAGKWGQNLLKTFSELGVLAAVVDSNVEIGQQLAELYQVNFFSNIDEMLQQSIDAVAIATPVFTHFELAKKALLANKDVFVEKPLTTNAEEADTLIELAKQREKILMVGHLLLYQPGIQFIKEFIDAGKLGALYSFRQMRRSLGKIRTEENVLYSFGVHDLAVLHYLVKDQIDAIIASSQSIISQGIVDDMTIHLHYRSGIQAHLHLSWIWPVKDRQLMILGEKGALHFDENSQQVTYYQHYGNTDASVTQNGYEVLFNDDSRPLTLELAHFLDCIQTRQQPKSDGHQGKDVVQLMDRIMQVHEKINDKELFNS